MQRSVFSEAEPEGGRTAPWKFSRYVLWRVLGAILVLFLVLTAVFVLVEVVPGDPLAVFVPRRCGFAPACASIRDQIIAQWGLDQPLPARYGLFLANVLTGNFGVSTNMFPTIPVSTLIANALPTTLAFLGVALVLVAALALAIGFVLSRRRGSIGDTVVSLLLAIPFAATPAVLGFLLLYALVVRLQLVPMPAGPNGISLGDDAVVMLVILGSVAALFTWLVRDHPLRPPAAVTPAGDWRPARSPRDTWFAHALAVFLAALPPLLPWIIGAVLLAEMAWNINGLGILLDRGVITFDALVVMGVLLTIGLLLILPITLAADLLHEWVTGTWVRKDGRSVADLTVESRDVPRGLLAVLKSFSGVAGVVLILFLVGMAVAAPLLVGPYPTQLMLGQPNQPPSGAHPLGTDFYGRDELAVFLYGIQPAFPVALLAFALALWAGVGLVAVGGLLGAKAHVFLSIPLDAGLILGSLAGGFLAFQVLGRSFPWIPALLAWPITTRILLLETQGLVPASRSPWPPRSASRSDRALNLIWGTSPLILGNAMLSVALSLSMWATFGLLGIGGTRPPAVSGWGDLLGQAWNNLAILRDEWWLLLPPALGILVAVLAPTLLGLSLKRIPLGKSTRPWPAAIPGSAPATTAPALPASPPPPPPGGPAAGP